MGKISPPSGLSQLPNGRLFWPQQAAYQKELLRTATGLVPLTLHAQKAKPFEIRWVKQADFSLNFYLVIP